MAELIADIQELQTDSALYKMYAQLYEGMQKASVTESPDIDAFVDDEGNVDSDGIKQELDNYTDIMMRNSAYNMAKAVLDNVNGGAGGASGSGGITVFTYTRHSQNETDMDAITKAIGEETEPVEGFIVIITDTDDSETKIYGYTGFAYSDKEWHPFSGRVDASNVIMRGNIVLSGNYTSVGNISKGSNSASVVFESNGLSVQEMMNKIFSKVLDPSVTLPSISSFSVLSNNSAGVNQLEVGTYFYPYWKTVFNPGAYTYNNTGVTVLSCEVSDSENNIIGTELIGVSEELYQQTETNTVINVKVNYSDGVQPNNNIGNPSENVKPIEAGSVTKSAFIGGYRKMFYGYSSDTDEITSNVVRGLTGVKNNSATLSFKESLDSKRIIIAAPKGTRKITKVIMPSSSNAEVTSEFVKAQSSVMVCGENEYSPIEYDIWIYNPSIMAGTYTVTLS